MATPRKSATGDTPAKVALNLDTYERENAPEPFVVVLGGKRLTFADPQELDWQDLMEIDDPDEFATKCLSTDDRKFFLEQRVPAFKLRALMEGFREHYGLGSLGNAGA